MLDHTCLQIEQEVFLLFVLGNAEELEALLDDEGELGRVADGQLGGYLAEIGPVHDDLLGAGQIGGDEQRRVALLLAQRLLEVLEDNAVHVGHDAPQDGEYGANRLLAALVARAHVRHDNTQLMQANNYTQRCRKQLKC